MFDDLSCWLPGIFPSRMLLCEGMNLQISLHRFCQIYGEKTHKKNTVKNGKRVEKVPKCWWKWSSIFTWWSFKNLNLPQGTPSYPLHTPSPRKIGPVLEEVVFYISSVWFQNRNPPIFPKTEKKKHPVSTKKKNSRTTEQLQGWKRLSRDRWLVKTKVFRFDISSDHHFSPKMLESSSENGQVLPEIIPACFSGFHNHGDVSKSQVTRVVPPLPNGLFVACTWGLLTTY